MGFTTGLLGGATLTYTILYMSLYFHKANRNVQHTLLSQQATLLNSIVEPLPPQPDPPAYEVRKAGLLEILKDRWNREIEHLVRNVQETDWNEKRALYETRISTAWEKVRSTEKGKELEKRFNETVVKTDQGQENLRLKENLDGLRGKVDAAGKEVADSLSKEELNRGPRLLELRS